MIAAEVDGRGILYGLGHHPSASKKSRRVFRKALDNVKPKLEVKSRESAATTSPVEVRPERRVTLAMRWLVTFSRDRGENDARAPRAEFVDAANGRGNA